MTDTPARFVIIESPYAGNIERNAAYLRAALADAFRRGEVPFASHGLYTQPGVLNDQVAEERAKGIAAGFQVAAALAEAGAVRAVYVDEGMSSGMRQGIAHAVQIGQRVEIRTVPGWSA